MLKKEFFVLGCGLYGSTIIEYLNNSGVNIVAVDKNKEAIDRIMKKCSYAVCADTTNIDKLMELNITKAKCVIVGLNNIDDSITTCANLVQLGVQGVVMARAINEIHARVLKTLGVKHVSLPVQEVAKHVALHALYNFNEGVYSLSNGFSWTKVIISNPECIAYPIKRLDVRNLYNVNILYVIRNGKLKFPINPDMNLNIGDIVAFMCPDKDLNAAINYFVGRKTK